MKVLLTNPPKLVTSFVFLAFFLLSIDLMLPSWRFGRVSFFIKVDGAPLESLAGEGA